MNRKPKRRDPDIVILERIGKYLRRHGWMVVTAGPTYVQRQTSAREPHYEFVMHFTGATLATDAKRKKAAK